MLKSVEILNLLAARQFDGWMRPGIKTKLRPKLGNTIDLYASQERVLGMLALSQSMGPVLFEVGKKVASHIAERTIPLLEGMSGYHRFAESNTIEEARQSSEFTIFQMIYEGTSTGLLKLVTYEKNKLVVIQVEECADCTGMLNLGRSICYFVGGEITGAVEVAVGKSLAYVETRCTAKGDQCCEFRLTVLQEQGGTFG